MNRKKLFKAAIHKNVEAFVIHVISQNLGLILIYLAKKTQIVLLSTKKVKILAQYSDFLDVFSKKNVLILLEITNLNQYAIKL